MTKTCVACGKSFEAPRHHPSQKACSVECRHKAATNAVERPCAWCGAILVRKQNRANRLAHSFCDHACLAQWRKKHGPRGESHVQHKAPVVVPCDTCGKALSLVPSHVHPHNFCGVPCRTEWQRTSGYTQGANSPTWQGGHGDYRGPDWDQQRLLAMERDGHRCQHCGDPDTLQVHHVVPYHTFAHHSEANRLGNLLTLCMSCHTVADWEWRRMHPETERTAPTTLRMLVCQRCGAEYAATRRGHRSLRCEACRSRTCPTCGRVFRVMPYREEARYCSNRCAGASTPVLSGARTSQLSLDLPG